MINRVAFHVVKQVSRPILSTKSQVLWVGDFPVWSDSSASYCSTAPASYGTYNITIDSHNCNRAQNVMLIYDGASEISLYMYVW